MSVSKSRPAAVYRLWAADRTLLYIGSAYDPDERSAAHADKPWWPTVVRRTDDWHPSRQHAYRAEMEAIKAEAPEHNRMGAEDYEAPATKAVRDAQAASRARGRAQSAAYRLRRQVIERLVRSGYSTAEASAAGKTAQFAYLEATGLFPAYMQRRA